MRWSPHSEHRLLHSYRAPLRDIRFVVHEVLDFEEHYLSLGRDDLTRELLEGILEQGARFAEDVLAPTNRVGDEHGLVFEGGRVRTPPGFKDAYDRYCRDGWTAMTQDPRWGGQGLPGGFALGFSEMLISGNMAWKMYSGLTESAAHTIDAHASEELKTRFLPKMVAGEWTGTMCLTEPHSGHGPRVAAYAGRAARRRHLPDHRHQDLHHRRRARPVATTSSTWCSRGSPMRRQGRGHQPVPRAEAAAGRRRRRRVAPTA